MSKAMVMLTEENEMIGFVMFAAENTAFSENEWEGDCIFTGVPKNPEVFNNPLCEFLQNNKNTEFQAKIINNGSGYSLTIQGLLSADLSTELKGSWSPINQNIKGGCIVPNTAS